MVATILNLVLNVFAIREFGMLGASVVSLVTNIGVGFGYVFASRNVRTLWTYGLRYALPMLATVGTAALLVLSHGVSPLYTFAPALLACTFVIYFVGYTPHERRAILALRGMLS